MKNKIYKLGILGCANITLLSILKPIKNTPQIKLIGIASSNLERAKDYAIKYNIPRVFNSYKEIILSNEIDCVYIALTNDLHAKWILEAIKANKHVLVEKPASLESESFLEIMKICKEKKIYLQEAVMVQHHPWQLFLIDIKKTNRYGKLKKIETKMSFQIKKDNSSNYRYFPEKGGGVFYDLGIYWLQFLQCFGELKAAKYDGKSYFNGPNGCDWSFNAMVSLKDNIIAEFTASFDMAYSAWHRLEFEEAIIIVPDFFRPLIGKLKLVIEIDDIKNGNKDKKIFEPQNYYDNQINCFLNMLKKTKYNSSLDRIYERICMLEKIYVTAKNKYEGNK